MAEAPASQSHINKLTSTDTELKRDLGLFSAINLVIGGVIGSGIFLVASTIAGSLPSPWLIILVWIVGGLLSMAGCLAYAELSAAMPQSGGQYVYLREAFGEQVAFLNGWTQFLVIQPAAIAGVAAAFAIYAGYFLHWSPLALRFLAAGEVMALTIFNYYGVKGGGLLNNIFTVAKVGAVLLLVGAGLFVHPAQDTGNFTHFFSNGGSTFGGFGVAMIAVLWAYQGWDYTTFIAEEVKDPKRNIPRALIIGMAILIVVYIITNFAYLKVMPMAAMAASSLPAADVAQRVVGTVAAALISIAIMVSCFGCDEANIIAAPRIYYAMAKDGLFFKRCASVHPKYKTPAFSLIVGGIWTCVLVMTNSFDQLYTMVIFGSFIFYALGGLSVFILRKKYPAIERPYLVSGWIVVVFIIVSLVFIINALVTSFTPSMEGLILIAIGIPAYYWFRKMQRRAAAAVVPEPVL